MFAKGLMYSGYVDVNFSFTSVLYFEKNYFVLKGTGTRD